MANYVVWVARNCRDTVPFGELETKLGSIKGANIQDKSERMILVEYPGTQVQLQDVLGYADKVVVTPEVMVPLIEPRPSVLE